MVAASEDPYLLVEKLARESAFSRGGMSSRRELLSEAVNDKSFRSRAELVVRYALRPRPCHIRRLPPSLSISDVCMCGMMPLPNTRPSERSLVSCGFVTGSALCP